MKIKSMFIDEMKEVVDTLLELPPEERRLLYEFIPVIEHNGSFYAYTTYDNKPYIFDMKTADAYTFSPTGDSLVQLPFGPNVTKAIAKLVVESRKWLREELELIDSILDNIEKVKKITESL
ncbi:MAG: hypothetical protein ABDI07_10520 [Candidatus Kryptonium sp.]